jgi:cell division protein FtsB
VERKEARAHRNRIAAQNFRDRRKAQFSYLERRVSELEEENRQLRAGLVAPAQQDSRKVEEQECEHAKARENEELRERIKTLEKGWDDVMRALATQVLSTNIAPPAPAPASEPPSTTTTEPPASQRPPLDSPASP